jgi:hypothetical protein
MKILSAVLLASFALTGCGGAISGKSMGAGSIYSNVKFNEQISDNTVGSKAGEACASSILSLIATGDASAAAAAKAGGVTKIATMDGTAMSILGLYSKYCSYVTGE